MSGKQALASFFITLALTGYKLNRVSQKPVHFRAGAELERRSPVFSPHLCFCGPGCPWTNSCSFQVLTILISKTKALGGGGGGGGGGNELEGPFGSPICESGGSVLGPELHCLDGCWWALAVCWNVCSLTNTWKECPQASGPALVGTQEGRLQRQRMARRGREEECQVWSSPHCLVHPSQGLEGLLSVLGRRKGVVEGGTRR